ncbi:MAG: hypothetical protein ACK5LS_03290 [Propioniciclava sp.]
MTVGTIAAAAGVPGAGAEASAGRLTTIGVAKTVATRAAAVEGFTIAGVRARRFEAADDLVAKLSAER